MVFEFIKNFFIKRKLANIPEDKLALMVENYLLNTQKEHAEALKTAQRLNKANFMEQNTRKLKREIAETMQDDGDDDDDYDDDDDDGDDFADKLLKDVASNILKPKIAAAAIPDNLKEAAKNLTPEQLKQIQDYIKS